MDIERILSTTSAGTLLGGLSWRPPRGGRHSMRRLYEARNLTTDATHYTLFQSDTLTVYGLYQPRASEENMRLPKGVLSAAHCFASRVGRDAPNAALILTVPAGEQRRDEKIYVVVLEDGVPVVDSLTGEMEARNALGSEDRPIWSDSPNSYPDGEVVDFEWLAREPAKASRVARIPLNPWPLVALGVAVAAAATAWMLMQQAKRAEALRQQAAAAAASDPVPKYLAALSGKTPAMAADREQFLAVLQRMFLAPVHVPGWSMSSSQCSAAEQQCVTLWTRKGGTYDDLRRARPDETVVVVTPDSSVVPVLDMARTLRPLHIGRHSLLDPARPLAPFDEAALASGPLWQVWKTADIAIDIKPPALWPQAEGVPPGFRHPAALHSGAISLGDVPGPFIVEALRNAPAWVSWETVRADLGEGDIKARLKFTAMGVYYASGR
jgi:hypothetical protein